MTPGTIHLSQASEHLRIRFEAPFSEADLDVVRSLRGRRWDGRSRSWIAPEPAQALRILAAAFGDRLSVTHQAEEEESIRIKMTSSASEAR